MKQEIGNFHEQIKHLKKENIDLKSKPKIIKLPEDVIKIQKVSKVSTCNLKSRIESMSATSLK